ncbi:hypothetical protein ACHAW5_003965 [Stephanodiscus triporus]|uniref:Uncharacterized protein n=1 Tax=Stephanodiscus triporus TaxID=2934178 RepID=A0ABD3N4F7_9STRA
MIAQQLLLSSGVVYGPSEKDQIRYDTHHPPMTMNVVRHQSSGSCYSTRSVLSNATGSSTRTHRRCRVEVSSVLLGDSGGYSEHTTERGETFAKIPSATRTRQERIHIPEMRGPGSDLSVPRSHSSCARMPSDDTLVSATSKVQQDRRGKEHQGGTLHHARSVEDLIRQLSFSPRILKDSSSSVEELAPSLNARSSVLPNKPSYGDGSARDESLESEKEENKVPPAPMSLPLPPKITRLNFLEVTLLPNQVSHNRNRTRSTSVSEMSESFVNEFVDTGDDASFCSSGHEVNEAIEEKSLITIDSYTPSALNLAPRTPKSLWSRARSSTFASDQSSYVSPCSSDDLTSDSCGEEEDIEDLDHDYNAVNVNHYFDLESTGHLSLEDGLCNASGCYNDMNLIDVKILRPRLNSETLRQWNRFCEEEDSKREIITKDQLIFRGINYLNKTKDTSLPDRESTSIDLQDNDNDSVKESGFPHARSFFSYTNSGSSSRTYSQNSSDQDEVEVISDLDFEMGLNP